MRLSRQQDSTDNLLLKRLPAAVRQATRPRTVTRKKKGVPGWFGAKETVHLPPDTDTLHSLNREFLSIQEERQRNIGSYADSLRGHNKELNRELIPVPTKYIPCASISFTRRSVSWKSELPPSIITSPGDK